MRAPASRSSSGLGFLEDFQPNHGLQLNHQPSNWSCLWIQTSPDTCKIEWFHFSVLVSKSILRANVIVPTASATFVTPKHLEIMNE
ncbi:hypothetical protein ZIOFF_065864 [Zingiber officinale]|uniref:Uncharacterized protein n=1 Tax=Zingiber officinale TaxID=94328 RepID=A0A8J5EXM4_ZINOF|nr:hypothetical protein ZIOFF_065864 [Zingiber officinale]